MTKPKLIGRSWKVVVNGKRAANGAEYGATFTGTFRLADEGIETDPDVTLYDVVRGLMDEVENKNSEMEFPGSLQITIYPQG